MNEPSIVNANLDSSTKATVTIGDLEVVESGMVHISQNQSLSIKLAGLKFTFNFKKDESDSTQHVKYAADNPKELVVDLINFNNALGSGLLKPLELGTLAGRRLLLTFFVWTPDASEGLRIVNYVFYTRIPNG